MEPLCQPWTLADLRHHWGGAYEITTAGPQSWTARRRDGRGIIRADSADALAVAIRLDYGVTPVPRETGRKDEP